VDFAMLNPSHGTSLPRQANQCAIFVEVVPRKSAFGGKIACAKKLISQVRPINSQRSSSVTKIFNFRFSEIYDCLDLSRLDRSKGRTRRHGRGVQVAMDASGIE
jgi:hypothetical protein